MIPKFHPIFAFSLFILMSTYIVYEHATSKDAITLQEQTERHDQWMEGNAEFFNPWQYRIFAPLVVNGCIWVYHTFTGEDGKIIPLLMVHFIQMIIIFYLSVSFYNALKITNPFLMMAGLMIVCYCIANSSFKSDLSFNTYFDVIFYLLAGLLIIREKYFWVIPVAFIAALNRETSGFIPFMVVVPFSLKTLKSSREIWISFIISILLFGFVFILVRWYFGYQPARGIHGMTSPLDYLQYNFSFLRLYPLLLGTLGIIPFIVLWRLSYLPSHLLTWFWLIVPLWFIIHFLKSNAVETRLFLVPQVLIFVPAFLCMIEKWYKDSLD